MVNIPATLAGTLDAPILAELERLLAPPLALRAKTKVEVELEAVGEGTFTLTIDPTGLTAKKGFAKDPLIAAVISKGGWGLIQRELQEVVDGLPRAPELKRKIDAARSPKPGDLDVVIAALKKLQDACVKIDVKGAGSYALARGPVDEATRVLTMSFDVAEIDKLLAGAPAAAFKVAIGGDRGLLTAAAAALAPVLNLVRT